jgi:tetratricopeptide (TPR) repeat protein
LPEAIAAFHKAIALDPKDAPAYVNLGRALAAQQKLPEAITAYQKAIDLDPKYATAYYLLGNALRRQQKLPEAIAAFHKAIELAPHYAEPHCNLGHALKSQGQFTEALLALEKGHELGRRTPGWSYPSATWVEDCQTLLALDRKLPAVLKGAAATAAEQLALADLCLRFKKQYGAAVTLFERAFAAQPRLAADWPHRYNAACAAALAGTGQGQDADTLPDAARARLRRQALDWLRADLTAWSARQPEEAGPDRALIVKRMRTLQADPAFHALREPAALARLPEAEQREWRALWDDVAALLARTRGPR